MPTFVDAASDWKAPHGAGPVEAAGVAPGGLESASRGGGVRRKGCGPTGASWRQEGSGTGPPATSLAPVVAVELGLDVVAGLGRVGDEADHDGGEQEGGLPVPEVERR